MIKILVGNKCDCDDKEKVVSQNEAIEFAKEKEIEFIEISIKENINIKELYEMMAIAIADKYDNNHSLFMAQWVDYNAENENENENENKDENKSENEEETETKVKDDIYIGTKKFFESNDFVPFKQTDSNRSDRVYYYQNICLSDPIFTGKSPEELRFEDKYNEYSVKGGTKINEEKRILPTVTNDGFSFGSSNQTLHFNGNGNNNDDQKASSGFSWSFDANNNNNNTFTWNWGNATNTNDDTKGDHNNVTNNPWGDPGDLFNDNDNDKQNDTMRTPTEQEIMIYARRLNEIYRAHNKEKLKNVPDLLDKYGDTLEQIHQLYLRVCDKYKILSQNIYISEPTTQITQTRPKRHERMNIDEFIIKQVSIKCNVSNEIAKQSLDLSLWNAEIAMNKINSLKLFNCDLSIFETKKDDEKQEIESILNDDDKFTKRTSKEVNRKANNEEICVYQYRLRQIYKLHESDKINAIKDLIDKNKHTLTSLHELYFRACLKYQISPQQMFISNSNEKNEIDLIQEIEKLKATLSELKAKNGDSNNNVEEQKENSEIVETTITEENAKSAYSLLFGSTANTT